MSSYNKVILVGNVTRDPELRHTPRGCAVGDVSIAINRRQTLEDGTRREETTFLDVVVWGKTAEFAAEFVRKGREVFVEGRLMMDCWQDKETGEKRSKLRVVADSLQPLGPRSSGVSECEVGNAE